MKASDRTMILFYQLLGKVFYGIAAIDKTVREEEIKKLKQVVQSEWIQLENSYNEFGDDSAYQIEIVFDWLAQNDWEVEAIENDFKLFKLEHPSLFTPKVNDLILKTASAIATSFAGKNKAEHVLISHLQSILLPAE